LGFVICSDFWFRHSDLHKESVPPSSRPIQILLLLALLLRLAWGLSRPNEVSADLPDQREYLSIARNLLTGQGLQFRDERFGDDVYAFRSPGYPSFLAGLRCDLRAIRVVQAILDTSTVLAIYLLATQWLDERGALLAAIFVALNPFLIFFTGLLLTETLFTTTLIWGLVMLSRKQWIGLASIALALLIRPAAAGLVPFACAFAAGLKPRQLATGFVIGVAASILILLPWAYRNHQQLGDWVWTTTNAGQTQYDGFRDGADGSSNLAELKSMPELRDKNEVERNAYLATRGRELMLADPQRSAVLAVKKIARTWSPVPLSDEYGSKRNTAVGLLYSLPLFVLTLIGLGRKTLTLRSKLFCLLPAIFFTASAAATVGSLRYRIPAEPMLAVIAAGATKRMKAEG